MTLIKKCKFSLSTIKYLGHVISADGISADTDKINALQNLPPPADVSQVRCFLGMADQLCKFINPEFADKTAVRCFEKIC